MKRSLIAAVALLVSLAVWAEINIEYTTPNIVVADETGTPIDGVSGSQNILNATQKVIELRKDGVYKLVRPSITMDVTGNEPVIIVPPVDSDGDGIPDDTDECPNDATNTCNEPVDSDGDGVVDGSDLCPNTPPDGIQTIDANGCYVVVPVDADGDGVTDDIDQCLNTPAGAIVDATGCEIVVVLPTALVTCPDTPTSETATRFWTLCDINSIAVPGFTANGSDYKMSFRVPKTLTPTNKGRITVFMHPSTSGEQFVTGSDSFTYTAPTGTRQIELHTLEQTVGVNPDGVENDGGWWAWSGFGRPDGVDNYNGKQITASIDYILDSEYGELVDIEKGIHLKGTSLGGAGGYMQAYILPKYQDKIAIVSAFYGVMNMAMDANVPKVEGGWGSKLESPELYNAIDSRIEAVWRKGQNIHWHWAGGSNDGLGRMDFDFIERCDTRKISCSLRWLKSGHGVNETGYTLPHALWLDSNQDVTLDKILPVITNNSANFITPDRGQVNRGMSWHHANIVDTVDQIVVPLKYVAAKNIGPTQADFPDMPDQITFDLTFRHVKNFDTQVGTDVDWEFNGDTGTATVGGDGLLTIPVTMTTSPDYQVFTVKKSDGGVIVIPPVSGMPEIVYTRVGRSTGLREGKLSDGTAFTSTHWDWMDTLPEVSRQFSNFNAPGQLIHQFEDGTFDILYDCMEAERPCVPLDPTVSPDGTKVAFTVMSASSLVHTHPANRKYPVMVLGGSGRRSHIVIHTFATGEQVEWDVLENVNDSSPVWLPDGEMMFTSTRGGFTVPYMHRITRSGSRQPRLFKANIDGSNVRDLSPHEVTAALHPYVHSSGRIYYSTQWWSHNLAYGSTNSSINWPGTTGNMWSVMSIDHKGGDFVAALGAHKAGIHIDTSLTRNRGLIVPHFFGERANGDMCANNYYRANNLGGGSTFCWPPAYPFEGNPSSFSPSGGYFLSKWALPQDNASVKDADGKYQGKTGYPEGVPGSDQMLITHFDGLCTQVASGTPGTMNSLESSGNIGCDAGIKMTSVIPSQHPSDLVTVVNDPDWHEFGARIVTPKSYETLAVRENSDGACTLASSDAGATDSIHAGVYNFNSEYKHVDNNGSLMEGIPRVQIDDVRYESGVDAIRFYEIIPNPVGSRDWNNHIGNKVKLLGDAPLLADNSFKVQLPCDTAYTMAGLKDGRVIMRDQIPQSLRPGEARVCTGCHLHSVEGKPYQNSLAFTAPPLPLLTPTPVPTFTDDILPIFESKCSGCHIPAESEWLFTYQGVALDYSQKLIPDADRVQMSNSTNDTRKYGLQKPMASKLTSTMYADESLLFWKASNQRTDGRNDSLYNDDIDFGADHPTDLTPQEINLIGDWIDAGSER